MKEKEEEEAGSEREEWREGKRGKEEVFIQPAKPHFHCLQWV